MGWELSEGSRGSRGVQVGGADAAVGWQRPGCWRLRPGEPGVGTGWGSPALHLGRGSPCGLLRSKAAPWLVRF